MIVKVAARASVLSRKQVEEVLQELQRFHAHIEFESHFLETTGDLNLTQSLRSLDKTDFFTREIDNYLREGRAQIGVHSAKDLPEPLAQDLQIVALTKGVDPRDVLILRDGFSLATLPAQSRIGTSSLRREATVQLLRNDLICTDIRGTIEKRLQLLNQGGIDGLIVAKAALIRLGIRGLNEFILPGESAPLQGRLAIVARCDDEEMRALFSCLDYKP